MNGVQSKENRKSKTPSQECTGKGWGKVQNPSTMRNKNHSNSGGPDWTVHHGLF